jgi:hypothetical protein
MLETFSFRFFHLSLLGFSLERGFVCVYFPPRSITHPKKVMGYEAGIQADKRFVIPG